MSLFISLTLKVQKTALKCLISLQNILSHVCDFRFPFYEFLKTLIITNFIFFQLSYSQVIQSDNDSIATNKPNYYILITGIGNGFFDLIQATLVEEDLNSNINHAKVYFLGSYKIDFNPENFQISFQNFKNLLNKMWESIKYPHAILSVHKYEFIHRILIDECKHPTLFFKLIMKK